jgi:hypothetical protein
MSLIWDNKLHLIDLFLMRLLSERQQMLVLLAHTTMERLRLHLLRLLMMAELQLLLTRLHLAPVDLPHQVLHHH